MEKKVGAWGGGGGDVYITVSVHEYSREFNPKCTVEKDCS